MAKEFINPNWHVILIHYPLGVFVLGLVIELFSFLYRRSSLRTAGRWMILIGALSGIPTALSGVYALGNVVRMELPDPAVDPDQPWKQVWQTSEFGKSSPDQREFLGRHVWAQSCATALAVVLVTIGLGASDTWRRRLYFPLLLGLLFSLAAMLWGAYYGGEMVYRHGTAVNVVQTKGTMAEATEPKPTESAADEQVEAKRRVEYYVPPLQLHVLLAGLAAALAFGALGVSMRAVAVAEDRARGERDVLDDVAERDMLYTPPVPRGAAAMDVARSLNPDAGVEGRTRLPVSRLWLLTSLVALGASASGIWFLAGPDEARTWDPQRLWSMVAPTKENPVTRRFVHVVTGGAIIVVPLLLALITRVVRRPKVTLTLFGLLIVAALALQVWLGVLLMLDTPNGSIYRFNSATSTPASGPATAPATAPTTQGIALR